MPNTKITKDKLKNHWAYSKRVYILLTAVVVGLASIVYTMANNHNPPDYQYIGIALVDNYADVSKIEREADKLFERGKAYDENLKKLDFLGISYGENENDYYGAQVYTVQLAEGECDIFIQNTALTTQLKNEGTFVALDTLPSFEAFAAKYPGTFVYETIDKNAQEGTPEERSEEDAQIVDQTPHVYSIDVSSLTGFMTKGAYSVTDKRAAILLRSANPDTAMLVLYEMFDLFAEPAE